MRNSARKYQGSLASASLREDIARRLTGQAVGLAEMLWLPGTIYTGAIGVARLSSVQDTATGKGGTALRHPSAIVGAGADHGNPRHDSTSYHPRASGGRRPKSDSDSAVADPRIRV